MTIRKARPGDEDAIHDSHMRSIREVCVHDHGEEEIKGWGYRERGTRYERAIVEDYVWVVEHDDQIEGHGFIKINGATAHIYSLYVTPVVLGKGYGKAIMKLMLNTAREQGVQEITLESSLTAHQFYQHFGFVDTEALKKVMIGGYPVRCIPMRLLLDT